MSAVAMRRQVAMQGDAVLATALDLNLARTKRLADGTIGYFARPPRQDDCFAAALATVLRVPIAEVPDPRIDERLARGWTPQAVNRAAFAELDRWLAGRGLRAIVHRKPPVRLRRWIGVIVMPGDFQSHCLVMSRDEVLFDPARLELADGTPPPQERAVRRFGLDSVGFGYSFQKVNRQTKETKTCQ